MKVHYEPVDKALTRVISRADDIGRSIEYIELSPSEWMELQAMYPAAVDGVHVRYYQGVRIEVKR